MKSSTNQKSMSKISESMDNSNSCKRSVNYNLSGSKDRDRRILTIYNSKVMSQTVGKVNSSSNIYLETPYKKSQKLPIKKIFPQDRIKERFNESVKSFNHAKQIYQDATNISNLT